MSARFSTGLRDALLATGSLRSALANGELRIYSGPVPASVDSAISVSNTLLCVIKAEAGAGVNLDTTATGGLVTKAPAEVWSGDVVATGNATFYRHVLPSDTDTASTTAARIQGTVGIAGQNMNLSNPALVSGALQRIESYVVSLPEV
jgi:Tfp pilus assembly protein PilX